MKTLLKPLIAFSFVVLAAVQPAHALVVGSVAANGNTVDTTFTAGNNVGVDFSFTNGNSAAVTFTRETGDAAVASFNSVIKQLMVGIGLDNVFLSLDSGAVFATYGSVTTLAGATVAAVGNAANDLASIVLAPATTEIYLGDPFVQGAPLTDWAIDLSALGATDSFTLTARAVDEPGGLVLMLGALAAAGFTRRRRA